MNDKQPPSTKPNYGSAIRVAQMIHWLHQQPFGISLEDLRERLGVHERTLNRYINTLKETFFDEDGEPAVEVVRGAQYGRLRFKRKGFNMEGTAYELMSLYLALDFMAFLDGTFLLEGAQEVLDRLQKTLLRRHGNETNLVLKDFKKKFFHWTEAPKDYSDHNQILEVLVKSLILQKNIAINYRRPGKESKPHQISPLSLLMYKRALYVVGRRLSEPDDPSHSRDLTFAVERIESIKLLDETFSYPHDYEPSERFRSSFGMVSERQPERVSLRFDAVVAANVGSRRWHPTQTTQVLADGHLDLSFELDVGVELIGWILGYGRFVKVLEPASLRDKVREELQQALHQYQT